MKTNKSEILPQLPRSEEWNEVYTFLESLLRVIEKLIRNIVDDFEKLQIPISATQEPVAGSIYFNTSDDKIYVYDGSAWKSTSALT